MIEVRYTISLNLIALDRRHRQKERDRRQERQKGRQTASETDRKTDGQKAHQYNSTNEKIDRWTDR